MKKCYVMYAEFIAFLILLSPYIDIEKTFTSSMALSELKVKCGVCYKVVTLNKVRSRSYFSEYHLFVQLFINKCMELNS